MKIIVENGVLVDVEVDYEKDICVKEFAVPDGIVKLANESLAYLPLEVETLYIPSSVEEIEKCAFFGEVGHWENLKNIVVEDGNKNYKSESGCLIDLKTNTVLLGTDTAVIPNYVEKIGFFAFNQRENLTEIIIPKSVKEIELQAFACCHNLKKVTVLGEDTNLDNRCFIACINIEEFNLPKNCKYAFVSGCLIDKDCKVLLMITKSGEIPSDIITLASYSCVRYFKDIFVPESVIAFNETPFLMLGGGEIIAKKDSPVIKYAKDNELLFKEV